MHVGKNFNTGTYLARASEGGRKLMAAWMAQRSRVMSTQKALNALLQEQAQRSPAVQSPLNKDLLLVMDRQVTLGSLRWAAAAT